MNRAQTVGRRTGESVRNPGLSLVGGPMDGWYVKPDAPVLEKDWWTSWPSSVRSVWAPGRYVRTAPEDGVEQAKWIPFETGA